MFTNNLTTTANNNMLDNFFGDLNTIFESSNLPTYNRRINKIMNYNTENDDRGVTLTMEVPGYNKKLIDVTIENNVLVIEGNSNSGDTDGFVEKFSMGDKFNNDGVEATIVDGLLTVSVPFKESVLPKQIKVKVG